MSPTAPALTRIVFRRAAASMLALMTAASPAFAAITNTVTVNGTGPTGAVSDTDTVSVTPETAAPGVEVTKSANFTDSGSPGAEVGDVITYTYVVKNTGNTFIKNVSVNDAHQGAGTFTQPVFAASPLTDANTTAGSDSTDNGTDAVWDKLAPGDSVTFTTTYTVVAADVSSNGGGDGDIDNTATAATTYNSAAVTGSGSTAVTLVVAPALTIVKTPSASLNVPVGTTVTYTYRVRNSGNQTVSNVNVADVANGYGTAPVPGSETLFTDAAPLGDSSDAAVNGTWDTLRPGDEVRFTATYVVKQKDVDLLQ